MGTSGISSLLSALNPSTAQTLSQLLGQSDFKSAGTSTAIQQAVNSILNSTSGTAGSGIDVTATVNALLLIEAAPEINLQNQVTAFDAQTAALKTIESDLEAFQTSVRALSDPIGAFSTVSTTSSNNNVVSATAANGTSAGTHTIVVNRLATTAASYSTSQLTGSTVIPSGSFDLQVGSSGPVETIPVDSVDGTDTLGGLVTYINNQDIGVRASVITDASGARLSLVSQTSGAAGALHTTNDTTGTSGNGMGFAQALDVLGNPLGANASLTVDGIPVSSASNLVKGAIPGLTMMLSGTSNSPVTIDVEPDLAQVGTAINNFVTSYNQLMTDINAQYAVNSSATSVPPLLGDASLAILQSQMLNLMTTSITGNGGLVNLQSIGIQMQTDGTLKVASSSSSDSMTLNDALINNFSEVQNLFQSAVSSNAGAGVAQALNTGLISLTDAVNGPMNLAMAGIKSNVTDLNTQITNFQYRLQQTQTQLMNQYSLINTMLEQMPQTLASINSQLDSLNPRKA